MSQLYRWRRELCGPARAVPGFAAVTIAPELGVAARPTIVTSSGLIEIELSSGARVQISGAVDTAIISVALAALAGRRR